VALHDVASCDVRSLAARASLGPSWASGKGDVLTPLTPRRAKSVRRSRRPDACIGAPCWRFSRFLPFIPEASRRPPKRVVISRWVAVLERFGGNPSSVGPDYYFSPELLFVARIKQAFFWGYGVIHGLLKSEPNEFFLQKASA
jgi:hypothetical protein